MCQIERTQIQTYSPIREDCQCHFESAQIRGITEQQQRINRERFALRETVIHKAESIEDNAPCSRYKSNTKLGHRLAKQ